MINELNNFYTEYSSDAEKFAFLMQFYEETFALLYGMADQVIDNIVIPDIGIYHYVPTEIIYTTDGLYDISNILIDGDIVNNYGLVNKTFLERIDYWNNTMPLQEKVSILDYKKKYIYLSTVRDGSTDKRNYEVIDFTLRTVKGKTLIKNVDYAFSENKIYLLKNISDYYNDGQRLIANDIAVDYKAAEKIIGSKVYTPYNETVTKNEYRDIVQTLLYVGLGGPTIKNLNETLNTLVGFGQFKVIDYSSARGHQKTFWDETIRGNKALNRFDFLIMAPPEITNDSGVLNMVTNYLKLIKLAYTDFYISPYIDLVERYRTNQLPHSFDHKVNLLKRETLSATEKYKFQHKLKIANEKIWPMASYPVGFDSNSLVKDVFKHLDDIALKNLKKLRDKLTATDRRKLVVSFDVLNASQKSDKINVSESAKKNLKTTKSENMHNLGTLLLCDNGLLCDSNTNVVTFDNVADITDDAYYDTIAVKLIRKSAL